MPQNFFPCNGKGYSFTRAHCKPPVGDCRDGYACDGCIVKILLENCENCNRVI